MILAARSETEISRAIRECAKLCLDPDADPLKCIDDFAKELITKGWKETDLVQFSRGTLHVLSYLRKRDVRHPKTALENRK